MGYHMRLGERIALISMIVFASLVASVATNYIPGNAVVPQEDAAANGGDATKAATARLDSAARRSPPPAPPLQSFRSTSNDPNREKALAVIILMLRDGRGAR